MLAVQVVSSEALAYIDGNNTSRAIIDFFNAISKGVVFHYDPLIPMSLAPAGGQACSTANSEPSSTVSRKISERQKFAFLDKS
ncbi:hypothetical protein [Massilia sp. TWP1-3-3]|uniref:hypothetical protein n=1 Tax=Massilia sp. TWP1-3-3 TaxID=2804573 RepID=UPI003CF3563E